MKFKLKKKDFKDAIPSDGGCCVFAQALNRIGQGDLVNTYGVQLDVDYDSGKDFVAVGNKQLLPADKAYRLTELFDGLNKFDDDYWDELKDVYLEFHDVEWELTDENI